MDRKASRLFVWGGGHADYAGNEVYAFDLRALSWQRLTEPARPDRERRDTYADGSPRSRHSYDYLEFVPSANRLLSFPAGGNIIGAHARLDPVSGDVFFLAGQRAALARYSPAEDRWRQGWGRQYVRVHATAAIDAKHRWFVLIGSGTDTPQALAWPLDQPSPALDLRPLTSGDEEIERAYAPGFDFHAPWGRLVAWAGGAEVYLLDTQSWRWTRHAPAPGKPVDPGPALSTGTYGGSATCPTSICSCL